MRSIGTSLFAAALLLVSSVAQAVTYIVPADKEMIQRSDDIVIATGVTSLVERTELGGIATHFTLRIEEVLKGQHSAGDLIVLTERGGRLGDRLQYIPGTPAYQPGERYLVFTETNRGGEPVTFGMGLGQFFLASEKGRALALRGDVEGFNPNFDPHVEQARDMEAFLRYIRGIVAQRIHPEPRYFVPNAVARWEPRSEWNIAAEATRASYLLTENNGQPIRWLTPSTTIVKATPPNTPPSPDGNAAVALALSQWNGTNSNIDYIDGGADNTATAGFTAPDGKDTILFNDPNGEVTNAAGIGGINDAGSPYTLDGETFWRVLEVDVVMNQTSVAQSCYNTVMVHEVGHTLGFRHSNQNGTSQPICDPPAVCSSAAIMNSAVSCSWNGILKPWDLEAAHTVYGSDPVCGSPGITAQPSNKTIIPPDSTSLRVTATGTEPLMYRWFIGNTGDTSRTIGTNSRSITVSPAATTNYWVRVTGPCEPSVDSNTVTVTVCSPPTVTTSPLTQRIAANTPATLFVVAGGAPMLQYQWYEGAKGDTTKPIEGATLSTFVSPRIRNATSFWARVTNGCGTADSDAAQITVSNGRRRAVRQ